MSSRKVGLSPDRLKRTSLAASLATLRNQSFLGDSLKHYDLIFLVERIVLEDLNFYGCKESHFLAFNIWVEIMARQYKELKKIFLYDFLVALSSLTE